MAQASMLAEGLPQLPVLDVAAEIIGGLETGTRAVLSAPPGAGKTTIVPLLLLEQAWCTVRIILLETRRLASSPPAGRPASLLAVAVGETVGYLLRLDNTVSPATRSVAT